VFSQQLDALGRDPQIAHWMNLLSRFLLVSLALVLIADAVIFFRWFVYQVRARRPLPTLVPAMPGAELYPAMPPAAPASEADAALLPEEAAAPPAEEAAPETEAAAEPEPLPPSGPLPPQFVRPPFAPQWSLTHPFVGGQLVILLTNIVVFFLMVFAALPVAMRSMGNPAAVMSDPGVERTLLYATIFSLFLQNALFVGVAAICLRWYGRSLAGIGLRPPTRRQVALGVGLGLALFVGANALEAGSGKLLEIALGPALVSKLAKFSEAISAGGLIRQALSPGMRVALFLGAAVAAPVGEEVFFRGLLYNALKYRYGITAGMVVSGLAFALVHISPLSVVIIFPMGVLLAYVYERTQSLWVTILMHAINNGIGVLLLWKAGT
jgi:membrane protease YdiL (CAAX protease family)